MVIFLWLNSGCFFTFCQQNDIIDKKKSYPQQKRANSEYGGITS